MADPALKLPTDVREALSAINKEVVTEMIRVISPYYDHVIVDLGVIRFSNAKSTTRIMTLTPFFVTQKTMGSTFCWFPAMISGSSYCTVENVHKHKLRLVILPPALGELFLGGFIY